MGGRSITKISSCKLKFKKNKMKYLLQQRCRTTRSCIIGPYHQGRGPNSIEKDFQRQARLHTVGFSSAERQLTLQSGQQIFILFEIWWNQDLRVKHISFNSKTKKKFYTIFCSLEKKAHFIDSLNFVFLKGIDFLWIFLIVFINFF